MASPPVMFLILASASLEPASPSSRDDELFAFVGGEVVGVFVPIFGLHERVHRRGTGVVAKDATENRKEGRFAVGSASYRDEDHLLAGLSGQHVSHDTAKVVI